MAERLATQFENERIREVALTLAVEATKDWRTSSKETVKWAERFRQFIESGDVDV